LPYRLIDTSTGRGIKTPGNYLLSPADLATIDILPELVATGVASLKIEGRMKSALYVAAATRAYREAIDALFADTPHVCHGDVSADTPDVCHGDVSVDTPLRTSRATKAPREARVDALAESFSRGFTTAYLGGRRDNSMMGYTRSNNRGVAVGRVSGIKGRMAELHLTKRVVRGDVLEVWTSQGQSVVRLDEFWATADGATGVSLEGSEGHTHIYLQVFEAVGIGDRVFRVRSAELATTIGPDFDNTVFRGNNGIVPLDARVTAHLGRPLELEFRARHTGSAPDMAGPGAAASGTAAPAAANSDTATSDATAPDTAASSATVLGAPVEPARTRPVTAEELREHIGRVGGTPFSIQNWNINLDEGAGIGFSSLHRLRAQALEALTEELLEPWADRTVTPCDAPSVLAPAQKGTPRVAAIVRDAAGARAAAQGKAELIYLHSLRFEPTDAAAQRTAGKLPKTLPVIRLLPAITHDKDNAVVHAALEDGLPVVANNLGELEQARGAGIECTAGASLGVYNSETLGVLARLGVRQAWLSPELSRQDIQRITPTAPVPLVLTVFGRQEVMVTEHCLLMAQGPCDQRCERCARRKAPRLLEDRTGYRFAVRTDEAGRSHLFNAVALDLTPSMPELVSLGVSTFVVDGTLLTTKELKAEVERCVRARDLAIRGAGSLPKREGYTTGHFFRGVL
jgi:putative protease